MNFRPVASRNLKYINTESYKPILHKPIFYNDRFSVNSRNKNKIFEIKRETFNNVQIPINTMRPVNARNLK